MDLRKASEFWTQLSVFTARYFDLLGHSEWAETPWGKGHFREGAPRGAIIHYTANDSLAQTVRWFMHEPYGARASANVVVSDRKLPEVSPLLADLPLIQQLPVTVVQCAPPERTSAHATWTNRLCYGLELVNRGALGSSGEPYKLLRGKHYRQMAGRVWDPYTPGQVSGTVLLLRYLQALHGTLQLPWILGHEQVQGELTRGSAGRDKRDPGPLFPLDMVRAAAFDQRPVVWDYEDSEYGEQLDKPVARERAVGADRDDTGSPASEVRFDAATATDHEALQVKIALGDLGYYHTPGLLLGPEDQTSVWIFQRMMDLATDGISGPKTMAALKRRRRDRGL